LVGAGAAPAATPSTAGPSRRPARAPRAATALAAAGQAGERSLELSALGVELLDPLADQPSRFVDGVRSHV
jgi:hypothetical protein